MSAFGDNANQWQAKGKTGLLCNLQPVMCYVALLLGISASGAAFSFEYFRMFYKKKANRHNRRSIDKFTNLNRKLRGVHNTRNIDLTPGVVSLIPS